MSHFVNEMLMAISAEMKRLAEGYDLIEDRLSAIERSQVGTARVLQLEEALRRILEIAQSDSWNVEGYHRDRDSIARMVNEALDAGTQPLPDGEKGFDFYSLGMPENRPPGYDPDAMDDLFVPNDL